MSRVPAGPAIAVAGLWGKSDSGVTIVPAKRAITIHDLQTHTAGISYGTEPQVAAEYEAKGLDPAAGFGWFTADKNEPICDTMERLNEFTGEPVHDKFSHAADALRGFAVTHKPHLPEPPDEPWMSGYASIPHPLAWMGG